MKEHEKNKLNILTLDMDFIEGYELKSWIIKRDHGRIRITYDKLMTLFGDMLFLLKDF